MKLTAFIAKRMLKGDAGPNGFSGPVVRVSLVSISLGVAVMMLSLMIVTGFQKEIRDKIIGFGSHIQISSIGGNESYESQPVLIQQDFLEEFRSSPEIRSVQPFALKPAMIQSSFENEKGEIQREIQGVVTKGISGQHDWHYFEQYLTDGHWPSVTESEILISKVISTFLHATKGDTVSLFFIRNGQPRERKFKISGLYETGLEEFDKQFIYLGLGHLAEMNSWGIRAIAYPLEQRNQDGSITLAAEATGEGPFVFDWGNGPSRRNMISISPEDTLLRLIVSSDPSAIPFGLEDDFEKWIPDTLIIQVKRIGQLTSDDTTGSLEEINDSTIQLTFSNSKLLFHLSQISGTGNAYCGGFEVLLKDWKDLEKTDEWVRKVKGVEFKAQSIQELYPDLFGWLDLLDLNIWVILVLMLIVALVNMCSMLLVIILEQSRQIGILKALGASNSLVKNIFIRQGISLAGKGLIYGNLISIAIGALQYYTHFLSLDQSTYFISYVPIYADPMGILMINAGTLLICLITLFLPGILVSRITPVKAIRFE